MSENSGSAGRIQGILVLSLTPFTSVLFLVEPLKLCLKFLFRLALLGGKFGELQFVTLSDTQPVGVTGSGGLEY